MSDKISFSDPTVESERVATDEELRVMCAISFDFKTKDLGHCARIYKMMLAARDRLAKYEATSWEDLESRIYSDNAPQP